MKTHPYIIRLEQLVKDLPDFADDIRAAHDSGESAPPEEARVHLARAVVLTLEGDAFTHIQLSDPTTGVAATQKALQDLTGQGYITLYSTEALAIHALDVRFQQGHIPEADAPKYVSGELDPTEHIQKVLSEFDFTVISASNDENYYLSPRF